MPIYHTRPASLRYRLGSISGLLGAWIATPGDVLLRDFGPGGYHMTYVNAPVAGSGPGGMTRSFVSGSSQYAVNLNIVPPTERATVAILTKPSNGTGSAFGSRDGSTPETNRIQASVPYAGTI